MNEEMKRDLEKAKEEIAKQSEQYEETRKLKEQEQVQRVADRIGQFLFAQKGDDFAKINKIVYRCQGNPIEDYIEVHLVNNDRLLAVSNNLQGITHLEGISKECARTVFDYIYKHYFDFDDAIYQKVFEINISR